MFISAIIFAFACFSLTRSECSLEENINDHYFYYSYVCLEITIELSYTNGTNNGQLSLAPTNYEKCAVISVDKIEKLEINGLSTLDFLELSISNIELQQTKSYTEVMSKLGVNSSTIKTVTMHGCPNLTLGQLKGFDEIWDLDISSSLSMDNGPGLGDMFPKLRTLRFDSNQLKQVSSLAGLNMLEELFFSANEIEELPDKFFVDNVFLTTIYIAESNLKKFSSDICKGLDNLESLNLYIGQISFPELGNCSELRQIYIESSSDAANDVSVKPLTELFPEMTKLSSIMLSNVELNKVSKETFGKNILLASLTLSTNNIEEISKDAFLGLTKLSYIDVSYNNISQVSDAMLPPSVERFSASGTLVKQFHITTSLPKLTYLTLSECQISNTFEFKNVSKIYPSLQYLDLQGNHLIHFILAETLDFVHGNDVEIDLSNNQIQSVTVLDLKTPYQGSSRIILDLRNNRLKCDCGLKPFLEILRQKNSRIRVVKDVLCDSPKEETLKTIDLSKMKC